MKIEYSFENGQSTFKEHVVDFRLNVEEAKTKEQLKEKIFLLIKLYFKTNDSLLQFLTVEPRNSTYYKLQSFVTQRTSSFSNISVDGRLNLRAILNRLSSS